MSDVDHIKMRLMGGPFDGHRKVDDREPPPKIWVTRCSTCGSHWFAAEVRGAEVYRRDEERDGWLVFVYVDERLSPSAQTEERELVPAGGIREGDEEESA